MTLDTPQDGSAAGTPVLKPNKGVTLVEEPETITPLPEEADDLARCDTPTRQHRATISGKKLTGRPHLPRPNSSTALFQNMSQMTQQQGGEQTDGSAPQQADLRQLLTQVVSWLHEEKSKRHRHYFTRHNAPSDTNLDTTVAKTPDASVGTPRHDTDLALDKLETILAGFVNVASSNMPKLVQKTSSALLQGRGTIAKKLKRNSVAHLSSDTEFFGDEVLVPNVEADLDNSRTLAYGDHDADTDTNDKTKSAEEQQWDSFKQDILRITHTLKLQGWTKIPIEYGNKIAVVRLSGALTNAVYHVKPPNKLPERSATGEPTQKPKHPPMELLLRIYGAQAEHLIDRDEELSVLRRLAQKKIGPRLLGTFHNGRFEEFLHAKTLEAEDIRVPETSKQIAKRMRELHEGIELTQEELQAGPAIFQNWDKYIDRCEKVITFLDNQVIQARSGDKSGRPVATKDRYTRRGFICGVEWTVFRKTYERYRKRLVQDCGGKSGLRKKLLFAHNDAQYGNLLRLEPKSESPLLQPSNQHRQLVVIDFEYAGPNTAGLEFANHFTEWCYNYHHPELSYVCNTNGYPTVEEQHRFVKSYILHRPQFNLSASSTPKMEGRETTNISEFMLDSRAPPGAPTTDYDAEEKAREKKVEEDIQRLLNDTRLWRIASSAKWIAWGIVQANVPELDESRKKSRAGALMDKIKDQFRSKPDETDSEETNANGEAQQDQAKGEAESVQAEGREGDNEVDEEEGEDEEEDFDYLGYAQDRAMFFWGDCLQMGLIKEDELPEETLKKVKFVKN